MICHGNKCHLRKYARVLQKLGYPICLHKVQILSQSAVYQLKNVVNYSELSNYQGQFMNQRYIMPLVSEEMVFIL